MKNESVLIRPVAAEDLSEVLSLCALHASYEKLPFQESGQEARWRADLFAESPRFWCMVAVAGEEIIGYATCMKQYATWDASHYLYLDCLFMKETFRGQGVGERLMEEVKARARTLGCELIQWQTPAFNTRAMKFYHRLGAQSKSKERFFLNP